MKRPSSSSLQFLAAAATSTEASTVMSYRPPYRAVQHQTRGRVSDQSSSGQFVTGDSHFQSVSDANRGFRPNFDNPTPYQSQTRPPTVYNPPPPHFYPPPYPYPPPPYFNPRPPPFNRNQGFRPRPQQFRPRPSKPLDYREWEFPKLRPPPQCERFKVLSYNILADYLASDHRSKLYFHIPPKMLEWEWRKRSIIFELGLWSADILCFQEVDKFQDLEGELKLQGYSGIWKMRTGAPEDGCAIFWRVSRFKLLHEECIEFNKLGLRDNVAQICVFESLNQNDIKDISALQSSLSGSNKVVICNIHVLYNPRRGEIKLGQIRVLLDRAHAVSKLWDDAPIVLSGDFNCTPKSPLYNFISEQKLNLSDLPRDELSGQASAEIRPPKKFSPDIRAQHADSGGGASVVVDHGELSQSGSPLVVQQQNGPERNSVNLPSINSLPQPQCVSTGSNVYVCNPNSGQCGNENGTSSPEMTKQTHQEGDSFQDETPDGGLRESLSSSQSKVGVLVNQMKERHIENICSNLIGTKLTKETRQDAVDGFNDVIGSMVSISGLRNSAISPQNGGKVSGARRKDGYEFTSVDSCNEGLTEAEHGKQMHDSIDSQSDTSIEQSEPKVHTENKIRSCEKIEVSFLSSNNTTDTISDPIPSGTSSELFHESSFPSTMGVSTMGSSESFSSLLPAKDKDNPSNFSQVNISCELMSTDYVIGGKMENLLLKELPETDDGDEVFGEDYTKFLSELHNGNEPFSSDFSRVRSDFVESDKSFKETEPHVALNFRYDPSAWTPMEIETATGNADCTLVEHPLKLRSTYAEVEDCSGTRDSNGEPQVTSYNRCFLGTVDYIWRSEGLQTVRVLAPIQKHAMQWTSGFPTKKWGSDHIALVSELAFVKGGSTQNS